jgi:glycosyltransferase involved in cell wall biosynthesis
VAKALFTIIIPTYNRVKVLSTAILSVINQSSDNWELVIIDDGSTDNSKELIQDYLILDKITYEYQQHSGVSVARNLGLKLSSTDYIIFLDSDDKLHPDLIKDLSSIEYAKYDLIFWEIKKVIGNKTYITKPEKLEKIYNSMRGNFFSGSVCYRKSILEKVGGFDASLKFGENFEMGMRIAQLPNIKTFIIPSVYLDYKVNIDSRPNSEPSSKLTSIKYLLEKHEQIYLRDSYSHSRLLYQIGYLNEKLGNTKEALAYFNQAFKLRPYYYKPILKILFYKWS